MTKFATRSKTMQLAFAATVLMPASTFAETPMTARQMLAHAQIQALNVPGDIKKSAPELDRSDKIEKMMSGPAPASTTAAAVVSSVPAIEPPMPVLPATTMPMAPAMPVAPAEASPPQARVNAADSAAATSDTVKASNAAVAMLPAAASVVESRPSAAAPSPVTAAAPPPAAAVAPVSTPAQPPVPAASTTATRLQPDGDVPAREKAAPARRQPKVASTGAPARHARNSGGRSGVSDASIDSQISRIMRRPDVQSLMSQYGLD